MSARRVVVTGIGAVCALGLNAQCLWESLEAGAVGLSALPEFHQGPLRFDKAGMVVGFPDGRLSPRLLDSSDRFAQFLLAAAGEAVEQSGIPPDDPRWAGAAIVTGSGIGGELAHDTAFWDMYGLKKPRVNPLVIPKIMPNAGASQLSIVYGVRGLVYTVSTACSSANHAIGLAWSHIRSGACDLALAGGSESSITFGFLKAWEGMRVVSPDTCRPFSRNRSGLILGEGGGVLVLESEESARARKATILAELAGFGMSADASHLTLPAPEGAALAMSRALHTAGMTPADVDYINAHGTGTPANDPLETKAIREVFAAAADRLAVSSTKSMHGHVLGGAGAVEAVATVLAIRNQMAPPTANFTEADPECDLDYVPNNARPLPIRAALSNSFAFGGLNAVLAFRAPD
ncbi:MAG: beta-ketoacyl-[acyl-carrier-protein] synthase family protein [Bryobacterales bacterium]|jgi:nodulation protein E|nr:beta-ketoacyl-[acyl-carrier-protein] synthase family protein [Bryobacterales bacterium]